MHLSKGLCHAFFLLITSIVLVNSQQIVNANDCYMRIQIPRNGQSTTDARITTASWGQTVQQVTDTIGDFSNWAGNNVQLWLTGGMSSYLYMGFHYSGCMNIVPQAGLNAPGNALTIILPSGVAKLQKVFADSSQLNGQQNRATAGIFGIAAINGNTLAPSDYAYTTGQGVRDSIAGWVKQWAYFPANNGKPILRDGQSQLSAIRGDGQTVVLVADLIA